MARDTAPFFWAGHCFTSNSNPSTHLIAQFRYDPYDETWTLYWQRQNESWERYSPRPVRSVMALLRQVEHDPDELFWF